MANDPKIVSNAQRSQNDLDRLNTDTRETEASDKPLRRPADEELSDPGTDAWLVPTADSQIGSAAFIIYATVRAF